MIKKFHQIRYDPKIGDYLIEPMPRNNQTDYSKLPNEVVKYSQYIWVCKFKFKLEEYRETLIKLKEAN